MYKTIPIHMSPLYRSAPHIGDNDNHNNFTIIVSSYTRFVCVSNNPLLTLSRTTL